MKTGLVLEGGGLRGIFTAGVLDVLMEEGIKFDGAVGVSAGAAFGSNYKSEQNRRAIRYNLRFAKDPRYSSIMSLIATGNLFNAQFCYHDIPEKLDPFDWETFRKNPMEFYLVCTDVETGKAVYHLCDNDGEQEMLEWFRASGSMPLVSRIVEIGDKKLLDGGIADSIPLRFMEEQGYERNLVVLTRPANYVKTGNPLMPMIERGLRDYPEGVEAIRNRHISYNEEVAYVRQREIGKYAFVIRPDRDLDIGRVEHDRTKIRAAYKAGRRKARKLLPEIMTFLEGAKADFSSVKASMVEENVNVSNVVKPSLVEDPTVIPEEKEGFGKSYEENSEEITGRENKDIPEELFGKVQRDACDGADEDEFEGVPAPAEPSSDAGAEPADAEVADAKTAAVTSASLVDSFGDTPEEKDEDQKVRVQEVRAVLLPEEEEELPAFQRPFPMDREPDQAFFTHEDNENTEAGEDTPAVEIAEEEEAEIAAEPEAEVVAEPEAEVVAEPEEPAAEEAVEEAEAEEPAAEETVEAVEETEAEEPAAEETAEAVEEAEAEEPAAEETAEAVEEAEAEEPAAEEPAAEETVEAAEEAEAEEPAAEEPAAEETAAEEPIEETRFEEPAAEEAAEEAVEEPAAEETAEAAEEAKAEEPAAEEPAAEEPIEEIRFEEPAAEETAEAAEEAEAEETAEEAVEEADVVEETSGPNPFRYRKKGRKQKKVWKPGNMTALKEKANDQTK